MFQRQEGVATCTREWADSRTSTHEKERTETVSRESAPPNVSRNSGTPVPSLEPD